MIPSIESLKHLRQNSVSEGLNWLEVGVVLVEIESDAVFFNPHTHRATTDVLRTPQGKWRADHTIGTLEIIQARTPQQRHNAQVNCLTGLMHERQHRVDIQDGLDDFLCLLHPRAARVYREYRAWEGAWRESRRLGFPFSCTTALKGFASYVLEPLPF